MPGPHRPLPHGAIVNHSSAHVATSEYSIALFVETSSTYGRQILRGIQRFNESENPDRWIATIEERDVNYGIPRWIEGWSGDGIICSQVSDTLRSSIRDRGIPFVELTDRHGPSEFTTVRSDDQEIGRLAAEHFHERGLMNYAFCGFSDENWSRRRHFGFSEYLRNIPKISVSNLQTDWYLLDAARREEAKKDLTSWLLQLPKPIGLLACNDVCGKQVIECCHQASISVPEDIAILGVDNDDLLCGWCHPPLSSVIPNAEAIGFKAAELLSEMFNNDAPIPATEHFIAPLGLFSRQSSDVVAVEDEVLAEALRFIRRKADSGITVADVLSSCEVSRSTLDRKMREFLGRTAQQEILRVRLQRVCRLLSQHELPIETIALECGYEHPEYLHVVFKREMGMTPGEYREAARCV